MESKTLFIILPLVLSITLASSSEPLPPPNTVLLKRCSYRLSEAVVMLCDRYGGTPPPPAEDGKRSLPVFVYGDQDNSLMLPETEDFDLDIPWLYQQPSADVSNNRFTKRRVYKGALADECCKKPCYVTELLQYCPPLA